MSIDVDALKASVDLIALVGSYSPLRKRGKEYVGLCVAHADHDPSMWVNVDKGIVHCFSCDFHADAIDFIRHVEGLDFKAACERLGAKPDWKPKIATARPEPTPERITQKPPSDAGVPSFALRLLGEPQLIFPIRDVDGSILGYECRYAGEGGKKEIRVWTWGARGDAAPEWACGHFNAPRPLYGLERLAEKPDATVCVFEGPKKADAARRLLPAYACIAWTGGANAFHKHDWKPIAGRKLLIWPDADEPGLTAVEKLCAILGDPKGLSCAIDWIDPNRMPDGWDVADAEAEGWDTLKLVEWAKPRKRHYAPPSQEPPPPLPPEPEQLPEKRKPLLSVVGGNAVPATEPDEAPLPAAMSEDALADKFADQHAKCWRYVRAWNQWFNWRADGWYKDNTALVDRLAVEITRQALYWPEASLLTPDGKRRVNSRRTAGAVRDTASNDRRIAADIDQWDVNPWLLGVPDGVVDLQTGRLIDAQPEQYITKRTTVAPADGEAPIWLQFLNTVTNGSAELIGFLQLYAGYALTGETREQCLAFLYGTGQNGKGVFINTLSSVMGDYAATADADVFMETDHQRHPTEMARLRGARLVTVDETDNSKRWNEKRVKRITGGGKIEARFMRQDDFEFSPQFKLLIAGNHKPQLRGVGKAIQRRIHLVPFTVTIPDSERDNELSEKLKAEYPQILSWMIAGCARWRKLGLQAPPEVLEATAKYIEGEDVLGEWLEERTEHRGNTERPAAYKNYRNWVEGRGERPWSSKAFWAGLEERGYTARKSDGKWFISDLSLQFNASDEPPPAGYYDR